MAKESNKISTGAKAGIGAGIAAIAAAAGAYYFYGSKHAAANRKQMKGWMIKAKGELVERMEGMKELSQENYNMAVDKVMDKYKKVKNIDAADLALLATDLRRHWKNISAQVSGPKRKTVKKVAAKKVR